MVSYIFGGNTGETPESLKRKRMMAEALLGQSRAPQNVGEGLNAIGQAILYRSLMGQIGDGERTGRDKRAAALAGLFDPIKPKSDSVAKALVGETAGTSTPTDAPDSYFAAIRTAESGGNDSAKNPRSSATGRYQFIESTWNNLAKKYPDLGLTPDGRTDPEQQERAIRAFTSDNADVLSGAGIPVTGGNLYAAHFLGADGARNVLSSDPGASVASIVGERVVNANPFLRGMSVADFQRWAAGKGGGSAEINLAGGGDRVPPQPTPPQSPPRQVASLDPASGLPPVDPYANIPAVDGMGQDQRAKFRAWNSDPRGNEAANMASIDPALRGVVERAKQIAGTDFVIGSGRRDAEQQRVAVANGWSKTMDSDHLGGGAADLWPVDENGAVVFDPQKQAQIVAAMKQAAGELGVDMEAGADWKRFRDAPHFGMTNQTPLDGAPIPTPRPGTEQQSVAVDRVAPDTGVVPSQAAQLAPNPQMAQQQIAQADPNAERLLRLRQALTSEWLNDGDRQLVMSEIERIQQEQAQALRFAREEAQRSQDRSWQLQDRSAGWEREDAIRQADRLREENDPVRALQLRKAQLEIAAAERGEGNVEFKVVNDRLIKTFADGRPPEDVTPEAPAGSGPAGPFSGNSVEAQSLNWLVENGKLTPEQAAQVGAGKPITDPSTGAIMFMTPQGIFSQQPGQPAQPVQSGGGSRLLSPSPLGQGSSPVQPPQPVPAETPRREGMIPLTPPKERPVPDATRNKVANVNQAFDAIGAELDRYAELVGKTGIEAVPGDSKDNLNTVRQGIMLQMKELFNLGVLNGPDLALMERMIYDPVVDPFKDDGLRNLPDQLYTAATGGAGERAVNSVTELKRMLTNIRDTTNRAAGTTQGAPAGRAVGGDAELEDLLRKYGG